MTKAIVLESINKDFSCNFGLTFFHDLWNQLNLDNRLRRLLPRKRKQRGMAQINKIKGLLFSFALGNDCIDDLDQLRKDVIFKELVGGHLPARTAGDFLAGFHARQVEKIQDVLLEMALKLRLSLFSDNQFILTMDATPHKQSGSKMEGLGKNYKGIWGLDSQNAYDQHGFSYLFDLRRGGTHSGKESELWIHKVFSKVPRNMDRYFRADSAYGKHVVYSALKAKSVQFTIVLRDNIGRYVRNKNRNLLQWRKTDLAFFGSKECQVAMALYPVKCLGNLRVVFIRKKKSDDEIEKQLDLLEKYDPQEHDYRHYSIVTNIPASEMNEEGIIEFYRGRANAENYIKEQKYGYDFLHFPCKRFVANQIWGLIGTFAHNMTRFLSFCMEQKVKRVRGKDKVVRTVVQAGYFAKKVRKTLIEIPCQVVRSTRIMRLKINRKQKGVIDRTNYEPKSAAKSL